MHNFNYTGLSEVTQATFLRHCLPITLLVFMCGWTSATGLNSHHTQHLCFLISLRVQAHRRCLLSVCLMSVHSLWDLELLASHGQFCRREALGLDTRLPWGRVDAGRTSREGPFRENHQVEGMQSYPDMAQEIYSKIIAGGLLIGMEDGQTSGRK